jgi:hypothetical protein
MLQLANRPEGRGFLTLSSGPRFNWGATGSKKTRLMFALRSQFIRLGGMKFHGRNARPNRPRKAMVCPTSANAVTYIRNRLARFPAKHSLGNDG